MVDRHIAFDALRTSWHRVWLLLEQMRRNPFGAVSGTSSPIRCE